MSIKAEPRIYPVKKPWHGLKELRRENGMVVFKTKTGTLRVLAERVDKL